MEHEPGWEDYLNTQYQQSSLYGIKEKSMLERQCDWQSILSLNHQVLQKRRQTLL
jgi:hypothetical protein